MTLLQKPGFMIPHAGQTSHSAHVGDRCCLIKHVLPHVAGKALPEDLICMRRSRQESQWRNSQLTQQGHTNPLTHCEPDLMALPSAHTTTFTCHLWWEYGIYHKDKKEQVWPNELNIANKGSRHPKQPIIQHLSPHFLPGWMMYSSPLSTVICTNLIYCWDIGNNPLSFVLMTSLAPQLQSHVEWLALNLGKAGLPYLNYL